MPFYTSAEQLYAAMITSPALHNLLSGQPEYRRNRRKQGEWIVEGWVDIPISRTRLKKELRKVASFVSVCTQHPSKAYSCVISLRVSRAIFLHALVHDCNRHHRQRLYNNTIKELKQDGMLPEGLTPFPPDRHKFGSASLIDHVRYNSRHPWQEERFTPKQPAPPIHTATVTQLVPRPKNEKPGS